MKGIVFNLLEDAVTRAYGEDMWDDLLEAAGLDGGYTSLGSYPDQHLTDLVAAASAATGASSQEIVRWFGREALPAMAAAYPEFFAPHEDLGSFLDTLNGIIHPEVRKLYPGADVPTFGFTTADDGTLTLRYGSPRRLCAFAEGLIEGAAAHFGQVVTIKQPGCKCSVATSCARSRCALPTEIERLRRRLERERHARHDAERIAEQATRALYAEVAERTRELESVVAMGREVAAALDSHTVGDLIASHLAQAVGFDDCGIYAWDRADDLVRTVGYYPPERRALLRDVYPLAEYPETARVLESRKTSVIDLADEGADASEVRFLASLGGRLMFQIPIVVNGQATGTVELLSRTGNSLHDRQVAIAQTMANEAGVLFENARLYAQIRHQAFYDRLTGLPNRALFNDRVEHALARRVGEDDRRSALFFVDIDDFKIINDRHGHDVGDEVLAGVATRLALLLRPGDTVARLSGDEFGVLVEDVTDQRKVRSIATRMIRAFDRPIDTADRQVRISVSVGVAVRSASVDGESLIRNADFAMYRAKQSGKGRYRMYETAERVAADVGARLRADLRGAVERDELRVHYQPIVDLQTDAITSVEALVRWQHPEHGLLHPAAFIDAAEETGAIIDLGAWVLDTACAQLRVWQKRMPGLALAVNVSGRQLQDARLVDHVRRALRTSGIDPCSLILEVTESILIADPAAEAMLRQLKAIGVRLAIDDFGTGYSSLSYLRRFPIDMLKIDLEFTKEIETPEGEALFGGIVQLGRSLGLRIVAEGIERPAQRDLVTRSTCDLGQGYLLARPEPAEAFTDWASATTAPGDALAVPIVS